MASHPTGSSSLSLFLSLSFSLFLIHTPYTQTPKHAPVDTEIAQEGVQGTFSRNPSFFLLQPPPSMLSRYSSAFFACRQRTGLRLLSVSSSQDGVAAIPGSPDAPKPAQDFIDIETFKKLRLLTGKVTKVEDHPSADKLLVLRIDDGSEKERTICAGVKEHVAAADLLGANIVFVANLKPRMLRGVPSEGMLLAAQSKSSKQLSLLHVAPHIEPGSPVS